MWVYDKKTEYPINIKRTDPRMAKLILTQYGGPNGELAASLRYLSQRFAMPNKESKAILTDIGTEELAHFEMIGAMVSQLVKDVPPEELERMGFGPNYAVHGKGVYPADSNGVPFTAAYIESMSDPIANLNEDLAAEQKARATYEFLINLCDDPDVIDPLRFLREREVVHYQRFGETLRIVQELLGKRKYWPNDKPTRTLGAQDMMKPNTNMRPEAVMPEMMKPSKNMMPEAVMPEMAKPNKNMMPEAVMPEMMKPNKNMMPEAVMPEMAKPNKNMMPEAAMPEMMKPNKNMMPEAIMPEMAKPSKNMMPEAVMPEMMKPNKNMMPEAAKPVKKPDILMPETYMPNMMNNPLSPAQMNKNPNPIAPFSNMKK